MNPPTEIEWTVYDKVFENKEDGTEEHLTKKAKIYRVADNSYIDITELRTSYPTSNFANFKKFKELEEDVGVKLTKVVTEGTVRKTYVHERILETVLRWYGLDENTVINKFVIPQLQIFKRYINNRYPILVHIKKQYASATEYCKHRSKHATEWKRCKSTDKYIKNYAKVNKINADDVIKYGLGYNSKHMWIPCELLPCLAQWGSFNFNLTEFQETLAIDIKNISLYCKVDLKTGVIEDIRGGYVYCVSNPLYGDAYKVGCTKKDPESRVREFNSTNMLVDFKLEFAKKVDDCYAMEKELHLLLAECRVRPDREFFKCPLEEIKDMFDGLG
jgi:hypothetical protein